MRRQGKGPAKRCRFDVAKIALHSERLLKGMRQCACNWRWAERDKRESLAASERLLEVMLSDGSSEREKGCARTCDYPRY